MADFRTKLFTLAGVAAMFAGMAHAQITAANCTQASSAIFVAAEGTTEQVADLTLTCGVSVAAASVNLAVYLSPAVTITSATLGSGSSAKSETLAGFGVNGAAFTGTPVNGVVSGSTVSFNNIAVTAGQAVTLTITNIKINASQIATSSGAPTAVTETVFVSGTNVTPAVLSAVNVAFSTNALTGVSTSNIGNTGGAPSVSICTGVTAFANATFQVNFGEGFAAAFKTQGSSASNTTLGSEFSNNTYTGYGVTAPASNTATSGTRVQVVLNNIPANVNVYVPLTISNSGATMTLVTSATGAYNAATASTANGAPGAADNTHAPVTPTAAALTVSSGSATAIYEETTNIPGAIETYALPVYLQAGAAAVTAPSSAITATVSFAPIGASSNVPNFVSGSSTATKNGSAFTACTTTLLFPFVTNTLGFDTGLAISNTSSDLLGTKNGSPVSVAAAQPGTCTLTFFGSSAPAAVTTPTIAAGTSYTSAASTLAPGFQGYTIASCNFLYAHGFAYVVYNLTQNNGAAMGYLADVLTSDRKSTITTGSVTGTIAAGAGTVSGTIGTSTVSSTTPER